MDHKYDIYFSSGHVFRLFANCKLVNGMRYSAIYDLHRHTLFRFDSAYYSLLSASASDEGISDNTFHSLDALEREKCISVLEFLERQELGHFTNTSDGKDLLPLSEYWDSPNTVTNALVDIDSYIHDFPSIIRELNSLNCRSLQIRSFSDSVTPKYLAEILTLVSCSTIYNVNFVVRWSPSWEHVDWRSLFTTYRNLLFIQIHSSPYSRRIDETIIEELADRYVLFGTSPISNESCCGKISKGSLSVPTARLYSELRTFNGCLNRKVAIRSDGQICNCPSLKSTFGNEISKLSQIVESSEFQRTWRLKKDDIETCKQCEFRYVCTDCRAYQEGDLSLGKPVKCSYDPATGQWNDAGDLYS